MGLHDATARRSLYESLPDKDAEEAWLWYAIGTAGKPLKKLQCGSWQLTPHHIHAAFGPDVFTGTCDFVYELCYWYDALKREKQTLDWPSVRQAIADAKGDEPRWISSHVKKAKASFSESGSRKRKSTDGHGDIIINSKHASHGMDTPPESPPSPLKSFKELTPAESASPIMAHAGPSSDGQGAGRAKRSSAQRASLVTSRMYREPFPHSKNSPAQGLNPRKKHKSISISSPTKLRAELVEMVDTDTLVDRPVRALRKKTTQFDGVEVESPEPIEQDSDESLTEAAAKTTSGLPLRVNASPPRSAPPMSTSNALTSQQSTEEAVPLVTARSEQPPEKRVASPGSNYASLDPPKPLSATRPSLGQSQSRKTSASASCSRANSPQSALQSRVSISPSASDSLQSYFDRIVADLQSNESLSAETLEFFLRELLPMKFVYLFDPGDLPSETETNIWPKPPPANLCDYEFTLVPLCVKGRWVLFVIEPKQYTVTIMDSFKNDPDEGFVHHLAMRLVTCIPPQSIHEEISWDVQVEDTISTEYTAKEDFGIYMFVLCLRIGAKEFIHSPCIDTTLWRTVLAALISTNDLDVLIEDWLNKLRSRYADSEEINEPWLSDILPEFVATKVRLQTAPRIKNHVSESLRTTLPEIVHLMAQLAIVAVTWLQDVLEEIPSAEEKVANFKRQMDLMLQSQSEDSELALSLAKFHDQRQEAVRKLQRAERWARQIQKSVSSLRDVVVNISERLGQFLKHIQKDNEASRAYMLREGKAEVNDNARKLSAMRKELENKERMLENARAYIAQCEKAQVRDIWQGRQ